jgi:hypothetical protein
VVNERVFRWWDYPLFALLTLTGLAGIMYFLAYLFSARDWERCPLAFSALTLLLLAELAINQLRWFLLPAMKRPRPMAARPGWKVGVATTFVPGAESLEMLEETVRALVAMDYPHDTWVLDEGDDESVKALCLRLGTFHFSRKARPAYHAPGGVFQSRSKHGNYNAWFDAEGYARYDIVVGFDPDHVPHPAFLRHALGYFNDPRVGYVQLPQVYYNQPASFIARGAAEETYSYYSATQMAAYAAGYPIVTGCHQCHRVTALKEVGGFSPHDADDLLITLYYRSHGWQGVYVPRVLAKGLTPVDWDGYLAQQLRWARSVLDIKFRIYPRVAGRLRLRERLVSFLHGFYYLQGLLALAGVVVLSLLLAGGDAPWVVSWPALPRLLVLWLALLACDCYRQRFFLGGRREWGLHWRAAVLQYAKWPYLLLALVDVLINRRVPYAITLKGKMASRSSLLVWPHGVVALVVAAAWVAGGLLHPDRALDPVLYGSAVFTMFSSLALILTAWLRYPQPYDRKLWEREAASPVWDAGEAPPSALGRPASTSAPEAAPKPPAPQP